MANKQQPTTPHCRTREELVIDTFRYMIRHGEAVRTEVEILLAYGGMETKVIYKVKPNER